MDSYKPSTQNPTLEATLQNLGAAVPILKWPLLGMDQNNDPGTPITEILDSDNETESIQQAVTHRANSDGALIKQNTNQPPNLPPRLNPFTAGVTTSKSTIPLTKTNSPSLPMPGSSFDQHHTLSLMEFNKCYSKQFPVRIKVTQGFYGATNHGTLSGQEKLVVLFEKTREVLRIKSQSEKIYSIPLSSSVPISLLYNPHGNDAAALEGTTFSTVSDIKSASCLPKVVSAMKTIESQDKNVTISMNEVLVLQKFDPVSNKLKVRSLPRNRQPSSIKELPLSFSGEFTTKPTYTALYPSDVVNYVHFPESSESANTTALVHYSSLPPKEAKTVQTNDISLRKPVQLMGFNTEDSLVVVRDVPESNIDSCQLFEIPLDGTLPVEVTFLESLASKDHPDYRSKFDPTQLRVWGIDTCEESQAVQRVFNMTLRPGHEMEGILLSEQIYEDMSIAVANRKGESKGNPNSLLLPVPEGSSNSHKPPGKNVPPIQQETLSNVDPLPDKTTPSSDSNGQLSPPPVLSCLQCSNGQMSPPVISDLAKPEPPVLVSKSELMELVSTVMQKFLGSSSPNHLRMQSTSSDSGEPYEAMFSTSLSRERDKLSAIDLCDIVSELVECEGLWYLLTIYLGVPKSKVDQISATHGNDSNSCRRGLLEGVSYWLNNTANPTWSCITKALYKLERKNLARRIAKQFGAMLPNLEPADSLDDCMPFEMNNMQEIKHLQKQMLEKSEELHDVDIRLDRNRHKLNQLQDELVQVRKRLDFNEEYTLILTHGSRIAQWKKTRKDERLQTLEGDTDIDDVRREIKELKTEIGMLNDDITTHNTRLRNAQEEITKLQQQLVFIGRQSEATTMELHSLQDRKHIISRTLNQLEDRFNHMIAGNHGSFSAGSNLGEEVVPDSTKLEPPEYYNIIIRNGKVEQRLHEKEVTQLQDYLQEKEEQLQKLTSRLQQTQDSLADVERKLIAQQNTEYWYTDVGNDLIQNENLKTSLQAEKVDYQLQIAATHLSKRDVKAKLDTRQKKLQQSTRRNEHNQYLQTKASKATTVSKKTSISDVSSSRHSLTTSSEDTDVFPSEPPKQHLSSSLVSMDSGARKLHRNSTQQRVAKPARLDRSKLTSQSTSVADRRQPVKIASRPRAKTVSKPPTSKTQTRPSAGADKSAKPCASDVGQRKRPPIAPNNM